MPFFALCLFLSAFLLCAEHDLFFRTVPDEYVLFLLFSGLPLAVLRGITYTDIVVSLVVFCVCCVFWDRFSRAIGGADVKITVSSVLIFGVAGTVHSLTYGIFSAGIFSVCYILFSRVILKKTRADVKKETIPFVPFLFVGALLSAAF